MDKDKVSEKKEKGAATTAKPVQSEKSTAVAKVEEVKPEVEAPKTAPTEIGTTKPEEVKPEATPPAKVTPEPEETTPQAVTPMSLADLQAIVQSLTTTITEHSQQISELQEALARKRKATPNGKVQIRDTKTGKVYPSKNNTYQSLLKAGELQELVDKGVFGADPSHNNFGWFALRREWPDRFEEIREKKTEEVKPEEKK